MADERACTHCGRPVEELERERRQHEALAANLPEEWVKAAEDWYSMHGAGLTRNLLAGAAPLIRAAERERAERAEARLAAIAEHVRLRMNAPGRSGMTRAAAGLILSLAEGSSEEESRER